MTEIAEQWHETTDVQGTSAVAGSDSFASLAGVLHEESLRLTAVAEACRGSAHELEEREGRLAAWEHDLGERQRALDTRTEELERWKGELEEIAVRSEEANERIAEATEREAALKSLAQELLDRYQHVRPADHD
jgi:chromosome segregation ATPase